jgi:hypothetical protein
MCNGFGCLKAVSVYDITVFGPRTVYEWTVAPCIDVR